MNTCRFSFAQATLHALPSGALHWPDEQMLVVSDLHFGKSARVAAVGGAQLPPYEVRDTLLRLEADLEHTGARCVVCLGDSFDAPDVETLLPEDDLLWLTRLQAGRRWIWIEGNHDPGPVGLGGTHCAELRAQGLTFRHIARREPEVGEVSGHYHPKARLFARGRMIARPCFLYDSRRLILPAYGTYTGGLDVQSTALQQLVSEDAEAILTGAKPFSLPLRRLCQAG